MQKLTNLESPAVLQTHVVPEVPAITPIQDDVETETRADDEAPADIQTEGDEK